MGIMSRCSKASLETNVPPASSDRPAGAKRLNIVIVNRLIFESRKDDNVPQLTRLQRPDIAGITYPSRQGSSEERNNPPLIQTRRQRGSRACRVRCLAKVPNCRMASPMGSVDFREDHGPRGHLPCASTQTPRGRKRASTAGRGGRLHGRD